MGQGTTSGAFRMGAVEAHATCTRCGQPIPLEGPDLKVACPHCQAEESVDLETWRRLLLEADEALSTMRDGQRQTRLAGGPFGPSVSGSKVRYTLERGAPRCHLCEAAVGDAPAEVTHPRTIPCAACGAESFVFPVDLFLRGESQASWVLRRPKPGESSAPAVKVRDDAPRPVIFQCPGCAAGLRATEASERLLRCRFCDSDVFIPDELWRMLHPVKRAEAFWVRFDGPTRREREAETEVREKERARDRETRRREGKRERETRRQEERRARARRALGPAWMGAIAFLLASGSLVAAFFRGVALSTEALVAWIAVSLVTLGIAAWLAGRPMTAATGYDRDWLMFAFHFWIPFSFVPLAGVVFAASRAFILARGRFDSSVVTTTAGASRLDKRYDAVHLEGGETYPAAMLMLWLTALGPLFLVALNAG